MPQHLEKMIRRFGPIQMTEIDGAAPLSRQEQEQLLLSYITTRDELNEAEQANIIKASIWARKLRASILSEKILLSLHKHMFCDVWKWAGKYRRTQRNIGIESYRISMEISVLLADVTYWIAHTTYEPEECCARFHHRLVYIHPFPKGNGRFSRLATDILMIQLKKAPFQWGDHLQTPSQRRRAYVVALQAADRHDMGPLLAFLKISA